MIESTPNPVPTPVQGQTPGNQPPAGSIPPAAVDNSKPSGGDTNQAAPTVQHTPEEINTFKRNAGRWEAHLKRSREGRRTNRSTSRSSSDTDNADPGALEAIKERDNKIGELASVNIKLQVKDKVRDMIESDEYKDLPTGIKRAIVRNPLGFATNDAHTVEDAVADIQDYLDAELSLPPVTTPPAIPGVDPQTGIPPVGAPPVAGTAIQTPPAYGSGPSNPVVSPNEGTEGKTGSARSTAVLNNLLKARKK